MKFKKHYIILLLILILISQNIFFDIYRGAVFNVIPHDDYAPYLLSILNEEGGEIAEAPYTFRILTIIPAVPFYYLLPVYRFTNLKTGSDNYLRALESLSIVSYISIILISLLIFQITVKRFGGTHIHGLTALLISFLIIRHVAIYSGDPIAILFICLLIYFMENKWGFSILILVSAGLNEKIIIIFVILFLTRIIFKTNKINFQIIMPMITLTIYFLMRFLFPYSGNESHLQPWSYFSSMMINLGFTISLKGFFLNILPLVISLVLFYFAHKEVVITNSNTKYFTKYDISPVIGLFIISHLINVDYNVGRIVLYCFPIYLPLASMYLIRKIKNI